jgi:SpoU rRNA methylase family enzyme
MNIISLFLMGVSVMVFNTAFNDISVISGRSVLLVEETGENR